MIEGSEQVILYLLNFVSFVRMLYFDWLLLNIIDLYCSVTVVLTDFINLSVQ